MFYLVLQFPMTVGHALLTSQTRRAELTAERFDGASRLAFPAG